MRKAAQCRVERTSKVPEGRHGSQAVAVAASGCVGAHERRNLSVTSNSTRMEMKNGYERIALTAEIEAQTLAWKSPGDGETLKKRQ